MRHNVAYTFTAEERNTLCDLLNKRMGEILSKSDYDPSAMCEKDKEEYTKLYNLFIQF